LCSYIARWHGLASGRGGWKSLVVGVEREVYKVGEFNHRQTSAALITRTDVFETARQKLNSLDLQDVQSAILEHNGKMSLIRKRESPHRI
jgi:uncharacterized membrane protein YcaP (DUF421 family)